MPSCRARHLVGVGDRRKRPDAIRCPGIIVDMKAIYGTRQCAVCGADYKSSHAEIACCSLACGHELRRRNAVAKVEARIGEPMARAIERRLDQGMTMQQVAKDLGVSDSRFLHRVMDAAGIVRRTRSEAVRLQWEGNDSRREAFGATISAWKRANPDAAREHSLIGNVALQTTSPTSIERALMSALGAAGIAYEFQYVVGGKFLCDFAFPAARLIVETDGSYWHRSERQRKRDASKDAYLSACGFTVLRLSEPEIKHSLDSCLRRIQDRLGQSGG
jgi:very-short-patch-repair endonuclease